jgi:hypothetical protein
VTSFSSTRAPLVHRHSIYVGIWRRSLAERRRRLRQRPGCPQLCREFSECKPGFPPDSGFTYAHGSTVGLSFPRLCATSGHCPTHRFYWRHYDTVQDAALLLARVFLWLLCGWAQRYDDYPGSVHCSQRVSLHVRHLIGHLTFTNSVFITIPLLVMSTLAGEIMASMRAAKVKMA